MSERILIFHGETAAGICADDLGPTILLTVDSGCAQEQIDLYPDEARRLGEWLIECAGGADKHEVVGLPMLVKNSRGWEVLGEDGARFRLSLMSAAPFRLVGQAGEE